MPCPDALDSAAHNKAYNSADFSFVPVDNSTQPLHPYTQTFLSYPTLNETGVLCGSALFAGTLLGIISKSFERCADNKEQQPNIPRP